MHHTYMSRRAGKILDFEFSITNIHKNIRVPDMYMFDRVRPKDFQATLDLKGRPN